MIRTDYDDATNNKPPFEYLSTSITSEQLHSKSKDCSTSPPDNLECARCDCEGLCGNMCGHTIDMDDPDPIYLCNKYCSCSSDCGNRLSRTDVTSVVCHHGDKGWCLKSRHDISPATYIGDYTGLIISSTQAAAVHSQSPTNYILTIREESSTGSLTTHIDATSHGSQLRFMNHSCEPNVGVVPMRDNTVYPRATCWTIREVKEGEELCLSYGTGPLGEVKCLCETSSCRGFLPLESF